MAKKTVEELLQEATGVKPKAKEKRQDYLKRLHGAVGELDDDAWKGLTTPAQKWANEATKAFDAEKDIPDFEDAPAAEEPAPKGKAKTKAAAAEEDETSTDAEEAKGEEEDTDVKKKTPAKAAAKPATKAAAKEAPAKKKAPAKRGSGGVHAVLEHVLRKPDDSPADIIAALKKDGITVTTSTVASARGFFKLVVRFLGSKKLLTKKLFEE